MMSIDSPRYDHSQAFHTDLALHNKATTKSSLLEPVKLLPYRIARKLFTASQCHFFGAACAEINGPKPPTGLQVEFPDGQRLQQIPNRSGQLIGFSLIECLSDNNVSCVALTDGGSLISFAWIAFNDVLAEFNHSGDPSTGLPFYLPDDMAYIFNVFVSPSYRGRRLYATMVKQIAQKFSNRGITKLILTTETTNASALKSVHRMGFRQVGTSRLFQSGRYIRTSYPPATMFGGVRVGRYVCDANS